MMVVIGNAKVKIGKQSGADRIRTSTQDEVIQQEVNINTFKNMYDLIRREH
jgi:hypothetical protein